MVPGQAPSDCLLVRNFDANSTMFNAGG